MWIRPQRKISAYKNIFIIGQTDILRAAAF